MGADPETAASGPDAEEPRPTGVADAIAAGEPVPFHVHHEETEMKLSVKVKALAKPFSKTILEPFLKAYNAKLKASEKDLTLDAIEKVMVGPGFPYRSDVVQDLSATALSLVPEDCDKVRVDVMQKVERKVKLVCLALELEATFPAQTVDMTLNDGIINNFLISFNRSAKSSVTINDVERVEILNAVVDGTMPVWAVVPRAGRTNIQITLREDAAATVPAKYHPVEAAKLAAEEAAKPKSQVFRVRCGEVELKITLPPKALPKTLRESIVAPFLGAYSKKVARTFAGTPRTFTPDDVARVEVDSMAVADAMRASSFVTGAPLVRVELFLSSSAVHGGGAAEAAEAAIGAKPTATPSGDGEAGGGEGGVATGGHDATHASGGVKANVDYSKWEAFDEQDDQATGGKGGGGRRKGGAAARAPTVRKGANRSWADWNKLHIDSDEEAEAEQANKSALDGRLLFRDPSDLTRSWLEEAEALFALSPSQAHGFSLAYPKVGVEKGTPARAGGGKKGEEAEARVAMASAGIDELVFDVFPSQEHMPGGFKVDPKRKMTRCVLWMPTPHEKEARSKTAASHAAQRMAARKADSEPLLPPPPATGLPLVVLAHGGLSHARGSHTLWMAWYLVRQYNCAVLAVDHMPHHGARTPYGSSDAENWPDADLSAEDAPWAPSEWERSLRRSCSELGYALDIVLALPSSAEIAKYNEKRQRMHAEMVAKRKVREKPQGGGPGGGPGGPGGGPGSGDGSGEVQAYAAQDMTRWLQKLADRSRMRLVAATDEADKPKMIDRSRVGLLGLGCGTVSSIPFLADDAAGSARVRAAVLGMASDRFARTEVLRERSAGGTTLRQVDLPGSHPPPPPEAFSSRMLQWAKQVTVPIHFVASEMDDRHPLERARALFDAFGGGEANCWQQLPGARALSVHDIVDQAEWLFARIREAPAKPRPETVRRLVRPVAPAASTPVLSVRRSERSQAGELSEPSERSRRSERSRQTERSERGDDASGGAAAAAGGAGGSESGSAPFLARKPSERGRGSTAGDEGPRPKLSLADHAAAARAAGALPTADSSKVPKPKPEPPKKQKKQPAFWTNVQLPPGAPDFGQYAESEPEESSDDDMQLTVKEGYSSHARQPKPSTVVDDDVVSSDSDSGDEGRIVELD